jgi:hypothetical protein
LRKLKLWEQSGFDIGIGKRKKKVKNDHEFSFLTSLKCDGDDAVLLIKTGSLAGHIGALL